MTLLDSVRRLVRRHPWQVVLATALLQVAAECPIELPNIPGLTVEGKTPSALLVGRLQAAGLLVIPAGANVLRFLPALNLSRTEAQEGLQIFESVIAKLAV